MGFFRKVEDEVKDVGRKIDDEITQPVKNTVEAIVEDPKKLAAVALAVAFPGAGAALGSALGLGAGAAAQVVGQALINATLNGGDVKSAVIAAALPVVGQAGASTVSKVLENSNITGVVNTVVTKAVTQGTTAALLGKDPLAAFVLGGVSAGVNTITQDIPGFNELPEAARNAVNVAVTAQLTKGDVTAAITTSIVSDAINYATKAIDDYRKDPTGITNRVVDEVIPQGSGNVEQDIVDQLSNERPDYSLTGGITFPSTGIKTDPITGAGSTVGESPVDYSVGGGSSGIGLNMPTSPNINDMGGGQGLTVKIPDGVLSEEGVRPTGTAPDLGDPDSFINKPTDAEKAELDWKAGLKTAMSLVGGATAGLAATKSSSSKPVTAPTLDYSNIYKDAPIKGFSMRKGEDGRYTPFIGDKAQLAKGGFVSKRVSEKTGKSTSFVTKQK